VLAEHVGEGKVGVMPLLVAITPGMNVRFEGEGDGSDGSPVRKFRYAGGFPPPGGILAVRTGCDLGRCGIMYKREIPKAAIQR
jgi:hypothetical protein